MKPLATPVPVHVFAFRPNGSGYDLASPCISEVNFRAMAGQLSRIPRFNALPFAGTYSFAQHAVHGADALLREGAPEMIAALFLLRTANVAYLGDLSQPSIELVEVTLRSRYGIEEATRFLEAIADMRAGWDDAIYEAAGLPAPAAWKRSWSAVISGMGDRLTATEARELLGDEAAKWPGFRRGITRPPIAGTIKPWAPAKAEFAWLEILERLIGRERVAESGFIERNFRPFAPANSAQTCKKG
jgi:hypothetical protein